MNWKFLKKHQDLFNSFHIGLERETLRIDLNGNLSKALHPKMLGSPLTHPYISTDFGEQQLEWNTPIKTSLIASQKFMQSLMHFTLLKNPKELFWPFSMPPKLDSFDIAKYGKSHLAKVKEVYREGLSHRYGKKLQMISGIHFNFSFDPLTFTKLKKAENSALPLQDFINEKYLGTIRNFLREGWILTYLFGASPAANPSFMEMPEGFKKIGGAFAGEYATSIRTSHLGYYSRVQEQQAISFNSFNTYLSGMMRAISTPNPKYRSIPSQLNANVLQIENEHYSRIRPKRVPLKGEMPLSALEKRGIEYLEVRAIDLDPFHPTGISTSQLDFLYCFLVYCLLKESPSFSKETQRCLTCNQDKVSLYGRKEGLNLKCRGEISLKKWGNEILNDLELVASYLGKEKAIQDAKEKLESPSKTPSAKILKELEKSSFETLGLTYAKAHKKALLNSPLSPKLMDHFEKETEHSTSENQRLETQAEIFTPGFEDLELSTQILIKKALEWNIHVDILDRKDQIIRLEKGSHIEYVKKATMTSKDTYITPHLLENKQVTKDILSKTGFRVPTGESFFCIHTATNALPNYLQKRFVIKPRSTNFGIGVFILEKGQEKEAKLAIKKAFSYGSSILIEEFCEGEEYRFLIIDGKCIGVAKRVPAHVIGDGKSSISSLVHAKNHDPLYYRDPKTYLHLGSEEKIHLKKMRLTPKSIPKKGRKVFLRENSNVSTGGEAIDMTDSIHPKYAEIAREATKELGAAICGVDMVITSPKKDQADSSYAIIELNFNPVLFIHAYPYKGEKRDVATPILSLLGYSKYA